MLNETRMFVSVLEHKSISAAARSLGLSTAAASTRIMQLEQHLGVQLLARTTRSLSATDAGRIFYVHALEVLNAMDEAKESMADFVENPRGSLRISAPLSYGRRFLAPLVCEFRRHYPRIDVRLRLTDHSVHMLDEHLDLAVRFGPMADSTEITRKIANCPQVLCAAPSYLLRNGSPLTPSDLAEHDCLRMQFPAKSTTHWVFLARGGSEPTSVGVRGGLEADDCDVLTEWALAGEGIALKPLWEVAEHLATGALVQILTDFPPEPTVINLVYPQRRLLPSKLKIFADFLITRTRLQIERPRLQAA